jgi:hypothetical protein
VTLDHTGMVVGGWAGGFFEPKRVLRGHFLDHRRWMDTAFVNLARSCHEAERAMPEDATKTSLTACFFHETYPHCT